MTAPRKLAYVQPRAAGRGQNLRTRVHVIGFTDRAGARLFNRSALCGSTPEYGFTERFGGMLGGGDTVGLARMLAAGRGCAGCARKVRTTDDLVNACTPEELDEAHAARRPIEPPPPAPAAYPEHEKLTKVAHLSQAIGDFVEWAGENGIHLARWETVEEYDHPVLFTLGEPITKLLARHFDIDLDVIETEKRAMLDAIRAAS
jgi:hypothetical protein